ncbi:MAG: copper resistance protein [Thermomicrobiales bacterium]|jgi:methionine-rich copper-binding protein CopC|nr:copper resistance protein [Thermomicrobiales bacterium]
MLLTFVVVAFGPFILPPNSALAHAEPERTNPPINGRVATAPAKLEVWFSEEVDPSDVLLTVRTADGSIVDQGDTAVDLFDPERRHVTVSLKPGLAPGNYVVQWHTLSALDGDTADGFFSFFVEGGTPGASPIASPASSTAATPTSSIATALASPVSEDPTATAVPAAVDETTDFDAQAFGLAVLAGVVVAIAIYLFWRLVRPKSGQGAPPNDAGRGA